MRYPKQSQVGQVAEGRSLQGEQVDRIETHMAQPLRRGLQGGYNLQFTKKSGYQSPSMVWKKWK